MHGVAHVLQGFAHGADFTHVLHAGFAQLEQPDDVEVDVAATATDANITATATAITISATFFMFPLLLVNCINSIGRAPLRVPYQLLLYF